MNPGQKKYPEHKITIKDLIFVTVSGILTGLAFPKFELMFLGWVSLIPLLYVFLLKRPRQAFVLGMTAGSCFYLVLLYWIPAVPAYYGGLSLPFSLLIYFLFAVFLSLFWAFPCMVAAFIGQKFPIAVFFLIPILWVSFELGITHILTGFPWGLLAYSQYKNIYLIQTAAFTGVYGISFILVFFQSMIVLFLKFKKKAALISIISFIFFIHLVGFFIVNTNYPSEGLIKGAVVQGNVPSSIKWEITPDQKIRELFLQHLNLSRQAAQEGARLVVWPELSVPLCFSCGNDLYQEFRKYLTAFSRDRNITLVLGTYETSYENGETHYFNSALCLMPDGHYTQYNKMHLVPFGEYTPYEKIFSFISNFTHAIGELTPGKRFSFHRFNEIKFGSPICYEIIFPDLVRRFCLEGAEFLITLTNDGWYGKSSAPYQHFSIAVFRAVENRRFLLRSATTGISGIIDPYGRILKRSKLNEQLYLTEHITAIQRTTIYTRWGNWFSYLSLTISSLFFILAVSIKIHRKKRIE